MIQCDLRYTLYRGIVTVTVTMVSAAVTGRRPVRGGVANVLAVRSPPGGEIVWRIRHNSGHGGASSRRTFSNFRQYRLRTILPKIILKPYGTAILMKLSAYPVIRTIGR
ncbi:Hypothetical protein CINCED_3A000829 [Cinara cedri]|uniref:Uncharacterized protein n=1 Tax=Cinara cedri TaxID=506608 RepID=A0A5E4M734_9HEMI|nr:Hypothetical protein CINCED_3A000829 [Cinara cedri]